jgi:pimeloyl-ACP methyl ester carboxylesterase
MDFSQFIESYKRFQMLDMRTAYLKLGITMFKRSTVIGVLFVCTYYGTILYILRFSLDTFVLPQTNAGAVELVAPYLRVYRNGNAVFVRRYGNATDRCVIFFPGQHGGIERYQHELFEPLVREGISVFAVSYPGQDGAKGQARFSELPGLVDTALAKIDTICRLKHAVFVGRSLGSMVAALQAARWKPKGLVLDGVSPSLSAAIYAHMTTHWYLRPASVLPIAKVLLRDYDLGAALDQLDSTRVIMFQGSLDARTPLLPVRQLVVGRPDMKLIEVDGARHSDTYIKAFPEYLGSIVTLLGSKPNQYFHPTQTTHGRNKTLAARAIRCPVYKLSAVTLGESHREGVQSCSGEEEIHAARCVGRGQVGESD